MWLIVIYNNQRLTSKYYIEISFFLTDDWDAVIKALRFVKDWIFPGLNVGKCEEDETTSIPRWILFIVLKTVGEGLHRWAGRQDGYW